MDGPTSPLQKAFTTANYWSRVELNVKAEGLAILLAQQMIEDDRKQKMIENSKLVFNYLSGGFEVILY